MTKVEFLPHERRLVDFFNGKIFSQFGLPSPRELGEAAYDFAAITNRVKSPKFSELTAKEAELYSMANFAEVSLLIDWDMAAREGGEPRLTRRQQAELSAMATKARVFASERALKRAEEGSNEATKALAEIALKNASLAFRRAAEHLAKVAEQEGGSPMTAWGHNVIIEARKPKAEVVAAERKAKRKAEAVAADVPAGFGNIVCDDIGRLMMATLNLLAAGGLVTQTDLFGMERANLIEARVPGHIKPKGVSFSGHPDALQMLAKAPKLVKDIINLAVSVVFLRDEVRNYPRAFNEEGDDRGIKLVPMLGAVIDLPTIYRTWGKSTEVLNYGELENWLKRISHLMFSIKVGRVSYFGHIIDGVVVENGRMTLYVGRAYADMLRRFSQGRYRKKFAYFLLPNYARKSASEAEGAITEVLSARFQTASNPNLLSVQNILTRAGVNTAEEYVYLHGTEGRSWRQAIQGRFEGILANMVKAGVLGSASYVLGDRACRREVKLGHRFINAHEFDNALLLYSVNGVKTCPPTAKIGRKRPRDTKETSHD